MLTDPNNLKDSEKAFVDLHGLTVFEAEESLFLFLNELPKGIRGG